jgi:hypothetical protein
MEGAEFGKALHAWRHPETGQSAEHFVEIYAIQMSHPPRKRRLYDKRRDEIAHEFTEKLKHIAILRDLELQGEIAATVGESVEVSYGASGMKWRVLRVIDNDDLRKRLGRSPDKRNAAELAFLDVDGSEGETEAPPAPAVAQELVHRDVKPENVVAAPRQRAVRALPEDDIQPVGTVYDRQAAVYRDMWGGQ